MSLNNRLAFWSLVLFAFLLPWENVFLVDAIGTISTGVGLVASFTVAQKIIAERYIQIPSRLIFLIGIFVVYIMISYSWSVAPEQTLVSLFTYLQMLVLLIIIAQLLDREEKFNFILQAYVLGVLVAGIIVLYNYANGLTVQQINTFRYSVTNTNENFTAFNLALGLPIIGYLIAQPNFRAIHILNYISIPIIIVSVLLTGSRTGLALLLVGGIFYLTINMRFFIVGLILAALLYLVGWPLLLEILPSQTVRRLETIDEVYALNNRTAIWEIGLEIWEDHLLLGVGSNTLAYHPNNTLNRSGHNTLITLLVEVGFIGTMFFAAIVLRVIFMIRRFPSRLRLLWMGIGTIWLLYSGFNDSDQEKITWFFLGLILAYFGLFSKRFVERVTSNHWKPYQQTLQP